MMQTKDITPQAVKSFNRITDKYHHSINHSFLCAVNANVYNI